jgi:5-methylcytosine-specific restriction enzyme subunit McrC
MEQLTFFEGQKGQSADYEIASQLQALGICEASLGPAGKATLSNFKKIGFVNLSNVEISIRPKVKVQNVLSLLDPRLSAFSQLPSDVLLANSDEWTNALSSFFALQLEQAFRSGPISGYKEKSEWSPTIKGRIEFSKFATNPRFASNELPIAYDEFTKDIPENVILKTGIEILISRLKLIDSVRSQLLTHQKLLNEVGLISPGAPVPNYRLNPLNSHYAAALSTAELIIDSQSLSGNRGEAQSKAFLIDMAKLFETFIELKFAALSQRQGLDFRPQKGSQFLDEEGLFRVIPDYLWFNGQRAAALADAKYKRVSSKSDVPNSDINQMIAYCNRFKLTKGHLIYADAPEFSAALLNSEIELFVHSIDLGLDQAELDRKLEQVFLNITG